MGTAMTDKQNELIVRLRNLKLEGFASEIENQLSNFRLSMQRFHLKTDC